MNYLQATQASAIQLLQLDENRARNNSEFLMLNLIRLKETIDYSKTRLASAQQASNSQQAFQRYIDETIPFLQASGGELVFLGDTNSFFIGPENECWDKVMLVKQNSVSDFFAFAQNQDYLEVLAHREASVEDSRLLPIWSSTLNST